jgi:hypothetical protein
MLSKHYAPQTKTILSEAITQDLILFDKKELECLPIKLFLKMKI